MPLSLPFGGGIGDSAADRKPGLGQALALAKAAPTRPVYLPCHCGGRLPRKASMPSRKSALE
jgi:hypothetical protein